MIGKGGDPLKTYKTNCKKFIFYGKSYGMKAGPVDGPVTQKAFFLLNEIRQARSVSHPPGRTVVSSHRFYELFLANWYLSFIDIF